MDSDILISIIVPMYNPDMRKLERCLDSISLIKHSIEVIIIDDGSFLVNVRKFCCEYIQKDIRFQYYHQKNKGVGAARNFGLSMVKGKFVCFVDSDDAIDSTALNHVDRDEIKNSQLVLFDVLEILDSGEERKREIFTVESGFLDKKEVINCFLLTSKLSECWGKLYRVDIINDYDIMFPEGIKHGEASIFNCIYFQYISGALYKKEIFYQYNYSYCNSELRFVNNPLDRLNDVLINYKYMQNLVELTYEAGERNFYVWNIDSIYTNGFGSRIVQLTKHNLVDRSVKDFVKKEVKPLILNNLKCSLKKKPKVFVYHLLLRKNLWFAFKILGHFKRSTVE